MNIVIDKTTLLYAMNRVTGIVSRKQTIAILGCVLLDADGMHLTVRATNLDIEATVTVGCVVNEPGKTCVNANMLATIAKNAADGADISMVLADRLQVKSGRSKFNLATLPPADFPIFKPIATTAEFNLTPAEFKATIGRVAFAQSIDATRHMLGGVHIYANGKVCGFVATNSQRLAIAERPDTLNDYSVTIPSSIVGEMIKLADEDILVRIGDKFQIESGQTVITSKLLDGTYPDVQRVIPTDLPISVRVNAEAFNWAIRRASVASDEKRRSIRLEIANGTMTIAARGSELDAADEVECEYEGGPISIGVNAQFLLDAIAAAGTGTVELAMQSKHNFPFCVRAETDDGFVNIVCPLMN